MPLCASQERKSILAVMEIEDSSGYFSDHVLQNATEMLRGAIASNGRFVVIDKSRQEEKLKAIIKETKKDSYKECYDSSCQIPLGQALSADTILRSTISCVGSSCMFTSELVDLAKEATVKAASYPFEQSDEGIAVAVTQLPGILAEVDGADKPASIRKLENNGETILPDPCFSGENRNACMSEALTLQKKNNFGGARSFYEKGCELKQAHSCNNLGVYLYKGHGGYSDREEALIHFEQACSFGDKLGCHNKKTAGKLMFPGLTYGGIISGSVLFTMGIVMFVNPDFLGGSDIIPVLGTIPTTFGTGLLLGGLLSLLLRESPEAHKTFVNNISLNLNHESVNIGYRFDFDN